jgi:TIR domain
MKNDDYLIAKLQNENWISPMSEKAFFYDVFISHRFGDDSKKIASNLRKNGFRVFLDVDYDITDKRVEERISQVILHSRFILVYVEDSIEDSWWCPAEFDIALKAQQRMGILKVILVLKNKKSKIPSPLKYGLTFKWSKAADKNRLFEIIRDGNRHGISQSMLETKSKTLKFGTSQIYAKRYFNYWKPLIIEKNSDDRAAAIYDIIDILLGTEERIYLANPIARKIPS